MSVLKKLANFYIRYCYYAIPAKGPAYSPVRILGKVRRKSLKFWAEIETFHLEQSLVELPRPTWRTTGDSCIIPWGYTKRLIGQLPSDWAEKHKSFLARDQKPERRRALSPGALPVLYFSSTFSARSDLPSPPLPLSAPGPPRMVENSWVLCFIVLI